MKLNDREQAMLAGEMGKACQWAIDHQTRVGAMFDAEDMVPVSQAHMMADPESLGEAGVAFFERIAGDGGQVAIPMITDPRGVDLPVRGAHARQVVRLSGERRRRKPQGDDRCGEESSANHVPTPNSDVNA